VKCLQGRRHQVEALQVSR